MRSIVIDFETRSNVDLKKCGQMNYAKDESTDILMLGYKTFGVDDLNLWMPGMPNPDFTVNIQDDDMLYAFNVEFELAIWNEVAVKRYGWAPLHLKNLTCLAALANRYGLPNTMGAVAEALGNEAKKNPVGNALIKVFCTPALGFPGKNDPRWKEFCEYCKDDVLAEEEILRRLPAKVLNPTERKLWEYTVHMNVRGIPVDIEAVKQIRRVSEKYRESQYAVLDKLTEGKVTKITQTKRIKDYCATRGIEMEDLTAYTVSKTLERDDLPDDVMQLLEMRAALGMSSIGKYIRMEDMSRDGRIYNNQRYYGAHTGRWTGSGVQLLNLPRSTVGKKEGEVSAAIDSYFTGDILRHNPIKTARALIRPMIKAEEGKLLCAADYSSIEYVVLEWFAGNTEALKRFDEGFDPYIDLAATIYGKRYKDISKDSRERQLGKVGILGCGYGAGTGSIGNVAEKSYGVKLNEQEIKILINGYRRMHSQVNRLWYAFADDVKGAVSGRAVRRNRCDFKCVIDDMGVTWLTIRLPSGRLLFYNRPFLAMGKYGPEVRHHGYIQAIKKWDTMIMTPGRITENIVQATARDILTHGMLQCRDAGLDVIWTCYDEVICEVPEETAEAHYELMVDCMTRLEPWAEDMPIKADGFIGKRYKKM